ncbi:MAG: ABC transporter permease [Candidatus Thiodiazotropha sp.]|jgi:lipopolysaccharide transport system permease protein
MLKYLSASLLLLPLFNHRLLLIGLIKRSLKMTYAGSLGGVLWVYIKPLLMVIAYYFVFDRVLQVRLNAQSPEGASYSFYLLSGLLPWLVFSESIMEGAGSLVREAEILKKTRFPLEIIPAKIALVSAIKVLPIVYILWLISLFKVDGSVLAVLYLSVWIVLQLVISFYFITVFSILSAAFRDVSLLVESFFPLLLFFSPVLYPIETVPETLRWVLYIHPYTALAEGYHAIILDGSLPSGLAMSIVLGWLMVTLFLSRVLLRRSRDHLVDWL